MTIGTRLFTWWRGKHVGSDPLGNRYFTERSPTEGERARRWVLFAGEAEASMVPPLWHAWLHHTIAEPPTEEEMRRHPWQKPHVPNLTGTADAYRPPGHVLAGGRRAPATGDYEPWRPG